MERDDCIEVRPGCRTGRARSRVRRRCDLGSGCVRVRRNVERLGGHVGAARRRAAGGLRPGLSGRGNSSVAGRLSRSRRRLRWRHGAVRRLQLVGQRPLSAHVARRPMRRATSTRRLSAGQDLSGVHDPVRVEDSLDAPHQRQEIAVLGLEAVDLPEADPVLAGAGAAAGEGVRRRAARSARPTLRTSSASSGSTISERWTLPSPACPTMPGDEPAPLELRAARTRRRRASSESGTQTSVERWRFPGRRRPPSRTRTRGAPPRAACAPSGRARRRRRVAPSDSAIAVTSSRSDATVASAPGRLDEAATGPPGRSSPGTR